MKNKRVLLTGAGGYIGVQLLRRLQENGAPYLAIDRTPSSDQKIFCLDLKDSAQTIKCMEDFKPDVVIHLATHSALAYNQGFLNSFREDAQVLYNILESLAKQPACRLLYFSTSYVYSGLPSDKKVTEESSLKPNHPFGIAKSFFEQFLLKNNPETVIFRLFSVFGPGNYLFPNSVHNMVEECKETGKVTVWGEGRRKMQYVFIQDVLQCLEEGFSINPGIYNVGGDEYLSTAQAAKIVGEIFKGEAVFLKDKQEGETLPFGDNQKVKKIFEKNPFTPFGEALQGYSI